MIYHLYFKSGERACNLKLYDQYEKETISERQLFANTRGGVELLKLRCDDIKLVSYQSSEEDKWVYIEKFEADGKVLHIYLSEKDNKIVPPNNCQFKVLKDGGILKIKSQGSVDAETFNIVFHYKEGDNDFQGKFIVSCIPGDKIYEVVLDFGSEASQMLVRESDDAHNSELFNECARHFYELDPQQIADGTYDQQEDDDNELFRSIYFLPKQAKERINIKKAIIARPDDDDPLLDFITKRDDPDKGQRLPNIKISNLSGERPVGIDPEKLHQGIVMRFIHEVVKEVEDKERDGEGQCGIRLFLLVPNVMGQEQLSDFIQAIRKYTDDQEFRQLLPESMKNVVFDIHSYSESDASFVSWFDGRRVEKGNYLIIDVGKGTTDFSIIKVENGSNAVSIYRSGFVGAGNALTYAMFVNYVVSMWGLVHAEDIIRKVLTEAKDSELYLLENTLENYKRKDNPVISSSDNEYSFSDKTEVKTIISNIMRRGDIGDDSHIIQSTIYRIIKKIVVNVKETRFKKVILSGRAFRYRPFREATISILEKFYHLEGNVIALDKEQLKKGCLYGPLNPIQISKQSDMIGIPIAVDVTRRNNERAAIEKAIDDLIKNVQDNREVALRESDEQSWKQKTKKLWRKSLAFCGLEISESARQEKKGSQTVNLDADNDDIRSIMRGELEIEECDENTCFYISDDKYETENDYTFDNHSKYTLFFDGNDFYVRDKKGSIKLTPSVEMLNKDMLYESLFPYPYRILDENYDIPDINSNNY